MNTEPLMDAIVDAVLFFELSGPELVNEDAAVEMLEGIASKLRRLGKTEMSRFLAHLSLRASQAEPGRARETLKNLGDDMGLSPG